VNKLSWRPYIALAVGLLAVSSASTFIRFAQQAEAPSLVIAMWRVALASLILTPFVLTRYRADLGRLSKSQIGLAMLSGFFLGIHFASWISSLEYTSVLTSVTLVSTNPLLVALVSPLLLRDRLSRATFVAILLAIAGGVILSAAGNAGSARTPAPLLGAFLALVGSGAVAVYFMIGRRLRHDMPVLPYIWITYGAAACVLIGLVLVGKAPVGGLPEDAYFWMTLTALVPQLIGHSSYNFALGHLSAAYVSLIVLGEPIFSTLLAALFLSEPLKDPLRDPSQILGGALILIALFVASHEEARLRSASSPTPSRISGRG
jgi:drug/metabolite transporter (DMT)-like permease